MFKQPVTPALTLEALIQWLAQQDPERSYIWQDPVFCLVGNYLRDNGSCWGTRSYSELPGYEAIAQTKPWTFGAALERAQTLALPAPARTKKEVVENKATPSSHALRVGELPAITVS